MVYLVELSILSERKILCW